MNGVLTRELGLFLKDATVVLIVFMSVSLCILLL